MATQTRLLSPTFHLDRTSREAGRRGVAKAREALAEAVARTAAARHVPGDGAADDATVQHHAHAA